MTRDQIRKIVLASIAAVAPEADPNAIDPNENLRDALDIDSMDFLNFVTALHGALHIDIPEADYEKMETIDGSVTYLSNRMQVGS